MRPDRAAHRPLPADSELVRAIAVLARAQQDAVWDRTQAHHRLRSLLREYSPGFLAAFGDLRGGILRPEARVLLAAAPTPADAARLTPPQLVGLLGQAGRQRRLAAHAARLHQVFAAPCLRQPPLVEQAMGRHALALLGALNTACANAEELAIATRQAFDQHPDANIITSFAGLGPSPAPGSWPSSAMTEPASPSRRRSRPTPAPPQSPGPAARACTSATGG